VRDNKPLPLVLRCVVLINSGLIVSLCFNELEPFKRPTAFSERQSFEDASHDRKSIGTTPGDIVIDGQRHVTYNVTSSRFTSRRHVSRHVVTFYVTFHVTSSRFTSRRDVLRHVSRHVVTIYVTS
jgi:hypothetical protein